MTGAADPAVIRLVERVARLDDAPEDEWFYRDVADLVVEALADVVTVAAGDAHETGWRDGYAAGLDASRNTHITTATAASVAGLDTA